MDKISKDGRILIPNQTFHRVWDDKKQSASDYLIFVFTLKEDRITEIAQRSASMYASTSKEEKDADDILLMQCLKDYVPEYIREFIDILQNVVPCVAVNLETGKSIGSPVANFEQADEFVKRLKDMGYDAEMQLRPTSISSPIPDMTFDIIMTMLK